MIKSLESFGDHDLIFKVTMRHKLKYLYKIMISAPNLSKQTVNYICIYTNILYGQDNEVIGDLDLELMSPDFLDYWISYRRTDYVHVTLGSFKRSE